MDMVEAIEQFFLELVGKELCVFLCAMIPIIELRGAIPLGAALDLHPLLNFALAIAGNLLPVPFILLFIRKILDWMENIRCFEKMVKWLRAKAEKGKGKVEKYAVIGLAIFVAIPLPGTGAWTGALVAALMGMRFPKAIISVVAGVLCAGVIMSLLSYGVVAAVAWF
ncbi:MAG: small multi-drug export protein [Clostridia bacterium]|nr:small multi-drug export protein [Clostridia bacterium]